MYRGDKLPSKKEDKPLSGFRKVPQAEDISPYDAFAIAVYGAANWLRTVEDRDWDEIAEKAVALYLSGVSDAKDIAIMLDCNLDQFKDKVDLEKIKSFLNADVSKKIYQKALAGDEKMLKLVAERRLGWGKTDHLKVDGEIRVRPILEVSLLTDEEEARVRKGLPAVPDAIEAEFDKVD